MCGHWEGKDWSVREDLCGHRHTREGGPSKFQRLAAREIPAGTHEQT